MSTPCLSIAPHFGCVIRFVECHIASAQALVADVALPTISHCTQTLAQQSHACLLHSKHEQTAERAWHHLCLPECFRYVFILKR